MTHGNELDRFIPDPDVRERHERRFQERAGLVMRPT